MLNGQLDSFRVNLVDLADVSPLVLVQVVRREHPDSRRPYLNAVLCELLGQGGVLLEEQLSGDTQRLGVGDADTLLELRLDSRILQELVQLRASAVDNNGVEAHVVEEGETRAELVKVFRQDGPADL